MRRSFLVNVIRLSVLAGMLGIASPVYCRASVSVPAAVVQPVNPSVSRDGLKVNEVKADNADKNSETPAVPVKSVSELEKELSNIKGRNDEMNEKVSKSNTQIIDTLKKLKGKKGISKKQIRLFNKNEEAIAGKLESLTKLIDGLKDNAEKITTGDKKLAELMKNEETVKPADSKGGEIKPNETKAIDASKATAESTENSDNIRIQLENLVWLQLDRNRLLLQIFDTLAEISALLP